MKRNTCYGYTLVFQPRGGSKGCAALPRVQPHLKNHMSLDSPPCETSKHHSLAVLHLIGPFKTTSCPSSLLLAIPTYFHQAQSQGRHHGKPPQIWKRKRLLTVYSPGKLAWTAVLYAFGWMAATGEVRPRSKTVFSRFRDNFHPLGAEISERICTTCCY